jgi:hypothetical protein
MAFQKIMSRDEAFEAYDYLCQKHRHTYGITPGGTVDNEGTLNSDNVVEIENLKTAEADSSKALKATGDGATVEFVAVPSAAPQFVVLSPDTSIPNARVLTGGANITVTDDGTALVDVSPQGADSLLDADLLDGREAAAFVWSVAKAGDTALVGYVTLSAGTDITLTQVGQDIEIAATAGGSLDEEMFLMGLLV